MMVRPRLLATISWTKLPVIRANSSDSRRHRKPPTSAHLLTQKGRPFPVEEPPFFAGLADLPKANRHILRRASTPLYAQQHCFAVLVLRDADDALQVLEARDLAVVGRQDDIPTLQALARRVGVLIDPGDGKALHVRAEAKLARRRRAEADGTFRPRYRIRAGIVATNWNSNISTASVTCAFEDDRAWSSPSI